MVKVYQLWGKRILPLFFIFFISSSPFISTVKAVSLAHILCTWGAPYKLFNIFLKNKIKQKREDT